MGTSLSGLTPATTFDGLLKVGDNDPLTADLKAISDGSGNDSAIQLSTGALQVNGDLNIGSVHQIYQDLNDLIIKGNSGTTYLKYYTNNGNNFTNQFGIGNFIKYSLVVGESTLPTSGQMLRIKGSGTGATTTSLLVQNSAGNTALEVLDNRDVKLNLGAYQFLSTGLVSFLPINVNGDVRVGFGTDTTAEARLHVKGAAPSGDPLNNPTALLVQNSAGTDLLKLTDDGTIIVKGNTGNAIGSANFLSSDNNFSITTGYYYRFRTSGDNKIVFGTGYNGTNTYVFNENSQIVGDLSRPTARLQVKGSGNDATTTALLVQNSSEKGIIEAKDNGEVIFGDVGYAARLSIKRSSAGNIMGTIEGDGNGLYLSGFLGFSNILFGRNANEGITINNGRVRLPASLGVKGLGNDDTTAAFLVQNSDGVDMVTTRDDGRTIFKNGSGNDLLTIQENGETKFGGYFTVASSKVISYRDMGIGEAAPSARLHIKGSGATSATTALLVQNSAGTDLLKVRDDGAVSMEASNLSVKNSALLGYGTNRSVGIGTGSTRVGVSLEVKGKGNDATTTALLVTNLDGDELLKATDDGAVSISANGGNTTIGSSSGAGFIVNSGRANNIRANTSGVAINGYTVGNTALKIYGQGTTSTTTALLVENSARTMLQVRDDGVINLNSISAAGSAFYTGSIGSGFLQFTPNNLEYSDTSSSGRDESAALSVTSTTRGFLPPRMTEGERNAIATPAIGLIVYQTDGAEGVYVNTSGGWKQMQLIG